jgi:transposase-like protein
MNKPENGNKPNERRHPISYTNSDQKNKDYEEPTNETIEKIKSYNQKVRRNLVTCILPPCPRCGTSADQFKRHELRKRQFNVIVQQVIHIVIGLLIRWACTGCGKTFTQYPDFALPYKRYMLPDIIQYAERYLESENMSYGRLVKKWSAGYKRTTAEGETQLWPSTIHRWLSTLGSLPNILARGQQLIRQKNPKASVTRYLSQLTVPRRKFKTDTRRLILVGCRQILLVERFFHETFHVSIFEKVAADCGYT